MNKFKLAIIAASLWMPILAYSEELPWLTFHMADETELSVAAEDLSISYRNGNLNLSSPSVDQYFGYFLRVNNGLPGAKCLIRYKSEFY